MVDRVIAACDGAAKGNPGPAGWAYVIADAGERVQRWAAGPLGHATNNVAELTALQRLLAATSPAIGLEVRTDSRYVMDAMTRWLARWKRNGWKTSAKEPVKNRELIVRIDALLRGREVHFVHVRAHQRGGDRLKALADRAASRAAVSQRAASSAAGDTL